MKSVLISIRPKWCEKIASGEKTIEVRKTAPKEVPFKAYIYCTDKRPKDNCWQFKPNLYIEKKTRNLKWIDAAFDSIYGYEWAQQKVIGEFICDKVYEYKFYARLTEFNSMGFPSRIYGSYLIFSDDYKAMCLSYDEVKNYGKRKTIYGWHISDLKIYDKPKELSEFRKALDGVWCSYFNDFCEPGCIGFDNTDYVCNDYWNWEKGLTRPPQSWQWIEEVKQ